MLQPSYLLRKESLGKNIHDYKKHNDNGDDLHRGPQGVGIKNLEHNWCIVSGCKTAAARGRNVLLLVKDSVFVDKRLLQYDGQG